MLIDSCQPGNLRLRFMKVRCFFSARHMQGRPHDTIGFQHIIEAPCDWGHWGYQRNGKKTKSKRSHLAISWYFMNLMDFSFRLWLQKTPKRCTMVHLMLGAGKNSAQAHDRATHPHLKPQANYTKCVACPRKSWYFIHIILSYYCHDVWVQ